MSKILSVDDSPSVRQLVAVALTGDGHSVTSAIDGVEAMKLVETQAFDLVITDFNMPRMNGLEFISNFRKANRFTPVLVLTTEIKPELKQAAKLAGATGWIVKPFDITSFRATVRKVLT